MSTVSCLWCDNYVEATNLRWPGYCSPACRDADRRERQTADARRKAAHAERRRSSTGRI